MKISFDFDSCLSTKRIQRLAKTYIDQGHEVWVTTSRFPSSDEIVSKWPWIKNQNQMLFEILTELGIPHDRVNFTAMVDKWTVLDGFDIHFDDDQTEIDLIDENLSSCIGILILTPYIYE